jgi:TfoX/Sxy family transcriptional regulator of competence genes
MAFDEALASRIRKQIGCRTGMVEKKMFGGVGFLLNGNMCCGVHRDSLIVRLAPEETDAALKKPHVRVFDISGRPMKGWLLVDAAGINTETRLQKWIDVAVSYAGTLEKK